LPLRALISRACSDLIDTKNPIDLVSAENRST
jgi:hypothetical protein